MVPASRWAGVLAGLLLVALPACGDDGGATDEPPGSVDLAGDEIPVSLTAESTADAWLAHPDAGPWLRESLGDSVFAGLLFDPRNGPMMRAIPLLRLSRMPGFPVTEEQVAQAVDRHARG